jgi:hypothetical protein
MIGLGVGWCRYKYQDNGGHRRKQPLRHVVFPVISM